MNTKHRSTPARCVLLVGLLLIAGSIISAIAASDTEAAAPILGNTGAFLAPMDGTEPLPPGTSIQTLLTDMNKPIALAFDPQGRLFYTEKETGSVRLYANGLLQPNPVITFDVDPSAEGGLLGIAVHPNFNTNHYIYVFYRCGTPVCLPDEDWIV